MAHQRPNINRLETSADPIGFYRVCYVPENESPLTARSLEKVRPRPENNRKMADFVTFTSKSALCLVRRYLQITTDENMERGKIG